jgi:hypothetical protein
MSKVSRNVILGQVLYERLRQIVKWGEDHQTHPHTSRNGASLRYWRGERALAQGYCESEDITSWESILWEEVTEALAESHWLTRRKELIQVMAVCLAEIEDGDARPDEPLTPVSAREHAGDGISASGQMSSTIIRPHEYCYDGAGAEECSFTELNGERCGHPEQGHDAGTAHPGASEFNSAGSST